MSDTGDEVKFLFVRNTSLRLVHIGGVSIAPDQVGKLVDDPAGINRIDVESSEFLELSDEEPEDETPIVKPTKKKAETAKSPTGATWGAK